jgi:hypothetical protein
MKRHSSPRRYFIRATMAIIPMLVLILTVGVPITHAGPGSRTLLNFDDLPGGTPVFTQYPGVTFIGGDESDHPIAIDTPSEGTISGVHALSTSTSVTCEHEFHCHELRMTFDEPQSLVEFSTGLAAASASLTNLTVSAVGLSASGAILKQTQDNSLCSETAATRVDTPLALKIGTPAIVEVDVSYHYCNGDPVFAASNMPVEIDNLSYVLPLNPLPQEHDKPVITSVTPDDGTTATGRYPREIFTGLNVTVHEHQMRTLTVEVNDGPAQELVYTRTDADTYAGGLSLTNANGLVAGTNTLVIKATDFDQPMNRDTRVVIFTFTPQPDTATTDDIRPSAFEVTQVIDSGPQGLSTAKPISTSPWDGYDIDYNNPNIPLLQDKDTLIRVYGRVDGSSASVANVPASMDVSQANCTSGCALIYRMPPMTFAGSSVGLRPVLSGITVNPYTPGDITNEAPNLSTTWNFVIPTGYVKGDLTVTIHLNNGKYAYDPRDSAPECASDQNWECQHNNTIVLHLHFQPTPTITVKTVLIRAGGKYTCQIDGTQANANKGKIFSPTDPGAPADARIPSDAQVKEIFRYLNMIFPMHVNEGAVTYLDIDVATADRDNLIAAIRDMADSDGQFIMGILPVDTRCPHNYGPNGMQSDTSFTAGYGGVARNGAWADADNPTDGPHELAHNIGFDHWACENRVPDDECGAFPIPHGGTDVIGTDIGKWTVIMPGDNSSNATPHEHDFMTYGALCGLDGGTPGCDTGEWVSWYTYDILYGNTSIGDYDTDDPPALSITGTISNSGAVSFQPLYQVDVNHSLTDLTREDDAEQLYTLQGYDAKGNVLFVHNFEPAKQEVHSESNSTSYYFREDVPVVSHLARIDLLKGTTVVGSLASPAPDAIPTVTIAAPKAGETWQAGSQQTIRWTSASPANLPLSALVQYSPDGGTTRYTLARNFKGTALTIDTNELPGGTAGTIYVEVSDGINTAIAQTGPITVLPKAPHVTIESPTADMAYAAPIPITYTAMAYDLQSGTSGLTYRWSADDGKYHFSSTGAELTLQNDLPAGTHTVTVSVTNAAGLTAKASVEVIVLTASGLRVNSSKNPLPLPLWLIVVIVVLIVVAIVLGVVIARRRRPAKNDVAAPAQP